jgi:broad specificity phosphatase PhoE
MDFGKWTGHRWESIQSEFGVSAYDWLDIICAGELPEGESAADLIQRVQPSLQRIIDGSAGQTCAVYCHGGIVRVMLSLLLEIPLQKLARVEIDYASVTTVRFREHERHPLIVEQMNFCAWR